MSEDLGSREAATDAVLAAERAHLAAARSDLRRMRERTLALDAAGGNVVSTQYLAAALHHRAAALTDDPQVPLFFGRIDAGPVDTGSAGPAAGADASGAAGTARWYVGRRHVHDGAGDPMVVDWRAEVSRPFYRATRARPMGVTLRRRFGFDGGRLTAYEDEHLSDAGEADRRSAILTAEIERPRVGPMRDIVATIQPEQDVVVRAEVSDTVCVQGAPGTGKTAVGLHRAAYLLYAHRERLTRAGVLVVGPNRSFLGYIAAVLPALGEVEVRQTTLEELLAAVPVRREDPPAVGTLKGDARMAEVLRRAVWSGLREPVEPLVLPRGSRRWRVPPSAVAAAVSELRGRGVRYAAGRTMLAQRLAHAVLVEMERAGESPDDRVQDAVARSRPVRSCVDAVWPAVDPVRVVLRLLSEPAFLAECSAGVLDDDERALLAWPGPARGPARAPWSAADAVLIDEARDLLDRERSLAHVVLDEAQDLSAMQLRAVGRRCSTGSATVLGDLAQATTPWAVRSWEQALAHLGKPHALLEILDRGYRVPADVLEYAARLLPDIAPGLPAPAPVREHRGRLAVIATSSPADVVAGEIGARRPGTTGVVVTDAAVAPLLSALRERGCQLPVLGESEAERQRVVLVPASLCKGLEFDWVVVVEPADLVAAEPRGLSRLYVALTRAVSGLTVVHRRPLPARLAAAAA